MLLSDLFLAMCEHDNQHAPGSDSMQWHAFIDDCHRVLGEGPSEDSDTIAPEGFAKYWKAVARRDYKEAALHGDVDPLW